MDTESCMLDCGNWSWYKFSASHISALLNHLISSFLKLVRGKCIKIKVKSLDTIRDLGSIRIKAETKTWNNSPLKYRESKASKGQMKSPWPFKQFWDVWTNYLIRSIVWSNCSLKHCMNNKDRLILESHNLNKESNFTNWISKSITQ